MANKTLTRSERFKLAASYQEKISAKLFEAEEFSETSGQVETLRADVEKALVAYNSAAAAFSEGAESRMASLEAVYSELRENHGEQMFRTVSDMITTLQEQDLVPAASIGNDFSLLTLTAGGQPVAPVATTEVAPAAEDVKEAPEPQAEAEPTSTVAEEEAETVEVEKETPAEEVEEASGEVEEVAQAEESEAETQPEAQDDTSADDTAETVEEEAEVAAAEDVKDEEFDIEIDKIDVDEILQATDASEDPIQEMADTQEEETVDAQDDEDMISQFMEQEADAPAAEVSEDSTEIDVEIPDFLR